MFFILRCVFWLGLVFAHIDWSVGQTADREAFAMRPLLTQMLSSAGSAAAKGAKDFCDSHRQDCIGALIATSNAMNDPTPESDFAVPATPAPAMATGKVTDASKGTKTSKHSLEASDLGPAWRGEPATSTARPVTRGRAG